MREQFQWVPDIFKADAIKTQTALSRPVYFDYGHYEVVQQNLQEKTDSTRMKGMKYPLVWLKMDFPEDVDESRIIPNRIKCHLVIAAETEPDYTMSQRWDKTFRPILYPVLEEILYQLRRNPAITIGSFTKWDHPYWGITSGKDNGGANLFNDYIDAIELRDLQVTIKRKIC